MGKASKLWIEGPVGRLEGALRIASSGRAAAVVAHPHPLHGGTLQNPVVFHADRELNRAGFHTLRFNFRGVGGSEGAHAEGRGEVDDVRAAVDWMRGVSLDLPLLFVGYSFGSWCGMRHAVSDPRVTGLIAIGLPVRRYAFREIGSFDRPLAVVQGEHDEFGTAGEVRELLRDLAPAGELHVVRASDHLFTGHVPETATRVVEAAESLLRSLART